LLLLLLLLLPLLLHLVVDCGMHNMPV